MAGTTIYYNRGTNDIPSLEIVVDPTDEFKDTRVEALFDALGLLPEWFLNSGRHPQLVPVTLWDAMDAQYGHGGGLYDMTNDEMHKLGTGGILYYGDWEGDPDNADPPLFPLARYTRTRPEDAAREILWQYRSGIVVIEQPELKTFRVSRMD